MYRHQFCKYKDLQIQNRWCGIAYKCKPFSIAIHVHAFVYIIFCILSLTWIYAKVLQSLYVMVFK